MLRTPARIPLGHFREIGDEHVDIECGEGGVILQKIVGVGDVGLMVFAVMDFHRARIDVRLESIGGVGQFREFVSHGSDLVFGLE